MTKRYQVFVSSTYTDLIEERRIVFQTLLEMSCFPAGMEFFLAADEDQLSFIKGVINSSDYYVLITGGRYGSMSEDGLSFTEQEFDYAVSRGIQVLVFTHKDLDSIPLGKSDISPATRAKLLSFLHKVQTGRLVNFWSTADELAGKVSRSISRAITEHPTDGWVRGNEIVSAEALADLNRIRNENDRLRMENAELSVKLTETVPLEENLQDLSDSFSFKYINKGSPYGPTEATTKWATIFALIAPYLVEPIDESSAMRHLHDELVNEVMKGSFTRQSSLFTIPEQDVLTAKLQFIGLRLIDVRRTGTTTGGVATFWQLTDLGSREMFKQRLLRKDLAAH